MKQSDGFCTLLRIWKESNVLQKAKHACNKQKTKEKVRGLQ